MTGLSKWITEKFGGCGFLRRLTLVAAGAAVFAHAGLAGADAETRTLKLYYLHTGEKAEIPYKKDGRYIDAGLKKINYFLRDWRRGEPTKMDPALLDLVWEVHQKSGSRQPINVVSAYRSPATNNMLRSRSRGVAKNSQHTLGKAMDFFLPDVKLSKLREIGLKMGGGGVGFYPTSGSPFVHLDTGSVRHWPRMSRQELASIFPDGRTLHVPSDGKPMSGYNQAVASYKSKAAGIQVADNDSGEEEEKQPNFFQKLAQKWKEDREKGNAGPKPAKDATQIAQAADAASEEAGEQKLVAAEPLLAQSALDEIALARIPVPTVAPRNAAFKGEPLAVASAQVSDADKLRKQVAAVDESARARFAAAFPEPRPQLALALADPSQAQNAPLTVAALTADEIEQLRSTAVPAERPQKTGSQESFVALGSAKPEVDAIAMVDVALAAQRPAAIGDNAMLAIDRKLDIEDNGGSFSLAAASSQSDSGISFAWLQAEPTFRPLAIRDSAKSAAVAKPQRAPARSVNGPSDRTLELALAATAESRGRAIEAIRALIEADNAGSPAAEPLTGSVTAYVPVPLPNPRKAANFAADEGNKSRATVAGWLTAETSTFRRPRFDVTKMHERPAAVLLAGFVKAQILQPSGRLVQRNANALDFASFR